MKKPKLTEESKEHIYAKLELNKLKLTPKFRN